jgi:phosphoketolase
VIQLRNIKIKTKTLAPELLRRIDAHWDVANDVSVGRIYLYAKTVCRILGLGCKKET